MMNRGTKGWEKMTYVQLFIRCQRATQFVRASFGFEIPVVSNVSVLDLIAGTVGTGPGCDVHVGGCVDIAAGGVWG